jgi:hypothetical protein
MNRKEKKKAMGQQSGKNKTQNNQLTNHPSLKTIKVFHFKSTCSFHHKNVVKNKSAQKKF